MRPGYLRGGSLENDLFETGFFSRNDQGDYQPSTPRRRRDDSNRREQAPSVQTDQPEHRSSRPVTPDGATLQAEQNTPATPKPPPLDRFPPFDAASDARGSQNQDENATEDPSGIHDLLENARLLSSPDRSPYTPPHRQESRRSERRSERRGSLQTPARSMHRRSKSQEIHDPNNIPILDTNELLERTEPSGSLLARITGTLRNGSPSTIPRVIQPEASQPTRRGRSRGLSRYRGRSTRRQSIDGSSEDTAAVSWPHIENIFGVNLAFPDHEALPQMQTQDGTAELRIRRPLPLTEEQLIRQAGIKWAQGSDPRDDVRFETIQAGYNNVPIQVHRTEVGGFPIPRRGSVPLHYELLDGHVGGLRVLRRSPRCSPTPQRRSTSQPARSCPRPGFSLSGTNAGKDSDEDRNDSFSAPRDIPQFDGMNPFASFLDQNASAGANNSAARSGPPPSPIQPQPQPQHQVNGNGGVGHVAGLANGVPHAGHQTDINYLWGIVQELSEVLKQNRNQTASIISSVQRVQAQAQEDGNEPSLEQVNGELNANRSAEIADLHGRLGNAHRQRDELITENDDLQRLVNDYEGTLQRLMEKLRGYAFDHTNAIIATHKHYNTLIEKEREANLAMRVEHGEWQAGLGRAAEFARQALSARSDELIPLERKCKELKGENRVLRRLVGWEVEEDSDEEEERKEEERRRNVAESLEQGNLDGHGMGHGLAG